MYTVKISNMHTSSYTTHSVTHIAYKLFNFLSLVRVSIYFNSVITRILLIAGSQIYNFTHLLLTLHKLHTSNQYISTPCPLLSEYFNTYINGYHS